MNERNQMTNIEVDYNWVAKTLNDLEIELIERRERRRAGKYVLCYLALALVGVLCGQR